MYSSAKDLSCPCFLSLLIPPLPSPVSTGTSISTRSRLSHPATNSIEGPLSMQYHSCYHNRRSSRRRRRSASKQKKKQEKPCQQASKRTIAQNADAATKIHNHSLAFVPFRTRVLLPRIAELRVCSVVKQSSGVYPSRAFFSPTSLSLSVRRPVYVK
ncbi:hypothetical protein BJ170DRAFT_331475 [Xylariales sp. AK1849]|nr:hypothetical protein BJ170DRAFT_331475 [Xylariales sp. AK1849]